MLGNVMPPHPPTPSLRKSRANGKPARFPLGLQLSTSKGTSLGSPGRGKTSDASTSGARAGQGPCGPFGLGSWAHSGGTARPGGPAGRAGEPLSALWLPGALRGGNQRPGGPSVGGALPSGFGLKTVLARPKQTPRH